MGQHAWKGDCGANGQPPCTVWNIEDNKSFSRKCRKGHYLDDCGVCRCLCAVECQSKLINADLQKHLVSQEPCWSHNKDPYSGYRFSPELLPPTAKVVVDIGGEGEVEYDGKRWGCRNAVNVNCCSHTTMTALSQPIPNAVYGFGEHLPFPDRSVDKVIVQNSPFDADVVKEVERVVKPGGRIRVCGPSDSYREGITNLGQHLCFFPKLHFDDDWEIVSAEFQVPQDHNPKRPRQCAVPYGFYKLSEQKSRRENE